MRASAHSDPSTPVTVTCPSREAQTRPHRSGSVKVDVHAAQIRAREFAGGFDPRQQGVSLRARPSGVDRHETRAGLRARIIDLLQKSDSAKMSPAKSLTY